MESKECKIQIHELPATENMQPKKRESILISSIGLVLHMIFVAIPKDILRWAGMKPKSIKGHTVVITGGASGIGKRMAEMISLDQGAKVAIIDVDKIKADETVRDIEDKGGVAKAWKCDITNDQAMADCAKEIKEHFGKFITKNQL